MKHRMVSINIPVYERLDLIERCVDNILAYTDYKAYEIVVADDGSPSAAIREWAARHPDIDVFIHHPKNMGIAQTRKDMLLRSNGDYIAAMDCDTIVTPGWLSKLVTALETGNGWDVGIYEMAIVAALLAHQMGYFLTQENPMNAYGLMQVETVGTACTLFRKSLVDIIGNFDPKLHNLWSDLDFCKRVHKNIDEYKQVRKRSPRIVIEPKVVCYHHGWIDPETGAMKEDSKEHTRSLPSLNTYRHKQWSLQSMEIIESRWGVKHPWKEQLKKELAAMRKGEPLPDV